MPEPSDEVIRFGRAPRWRDYALLFALAGVAGLWLAAWDDRTAEVEAWLAPYGAAAGALSTRGAVLAFLCWPFAVVAAFFAWRVWTSQVEVTDEWLRLHQFPTRDGASPVCTQHITERVTGPAWLRVRAIGALPLRFRCSPDLLPTVTDRIDAWRTRDPGERPVILTPPPRAGRTLLILILVLAAEYGAWRLAEQSVEDLGVIHVAVVTALAMPGVAVLLRGLSPLLQGRFGAVQVGQRWIVAGDVVCAWRDVVEAAVGDGHLALATDRRRIAVRLPRERIDEARRLIAARLSGGGTGLLRELPGWARARRRALRDAVTVFTLPALVCLAAILLQHGPDAQVATFVDRFGQTAYVVGVRGGARPELVVVDTRSVPAGRVAIVTEGVIGSRRWRRFDGEVAPVDVVDLRAGKVRLEGSADVAIPPGTTFIHLTPGGVLAGKVEWRPTSPPRDIEDAWAAARVLLGPGRETLGSLPFGPALSPVVALDDRRCLPTFVAAWAPASTPKPYRAFALGFTSARLVRAQERPQGPRLVASLASGEVRALVIEEAAGLVRVERPDLVVGPPGAPIRTRAAFVYVSADGRVHTSSSGLPPWPLVAECVDAVRAGEPMSYAADVLAGGADWKEILPSAQ